MLDRQDERELVIAAQTGDQKAMLRLINAHEPMIGRIVRQWRPRDPEDLHTHLVITFIETLPRFQIEKGFRVSTYLRWYLIEAARQFTASAVNVARMPEGLTRYGGFIRREIARIEKSGKIFGASHKRDIAKQLGISVTDLELIINHAQPNVSMDTLTPDNDIFMEAPLQDKIILEKQKRQILAEAIAKLNPRERRVIEARHATHNDPITLGDLSIEYGVSRERIRQIEVKALGKIKDYVIRLNAARSMTLAAQSSLQFG